MSSVKLINNQVIDTKEYETISADFVRFTPELIHAEETIFPELFPNLYKRGIYIGNDNAPLFSPEMGVKTCDGYFQFNTKEDLLQLCESYGCLFTLENRQLTLEEFKKIYPLLTDRSYYPILTEWVVNFIYTKIMFVDHPEANLVKGDLFNISNHILLEEPIVDISDYPTTDVWTYLYLVNPKLNSGDLAVISQSLDRFIKMFEDSIYKKFPMSAKLETKSTGIVIYVLPSPSSKRYMLNYEVLKETNANS